MKIFLGFSATFNITLRTLKVVGMPELKISWPNQISLEPKKTFHFILRNTKHL